MDATTRLCAGPVIVTQRPDQAVEGQFSIVSDFLHAKGEWRDVYVEVSGYFGSHGPHVFAAAPEMLEALRTKRDYVSDAASGALTYEGSGEGFKAMALEDLARIDAAIAKAEGRSNA